MSSSDAPVSPPFADFQLGEWRVRPALNRLERGGDARHLEPKQMDLLRALAAEPRRVFPKEELLDRVWGHAHVSDGVLTRAVAHLRKALDDDAAAPRYIETIPKRGYRLLAAVDGATGDGAGPGAAAGSGAAASKSAAADPETTADDVPGAEIVPASERATAPAPRAGVWKARAAALAGPLAGAAAIGLVFWVIAGRPAPPDAGGPDAAPSETPAPQAALAPARLVQLTTTYETEAFPAYFPDGSEIVYAADSGGRFELYRLQLIPDARPVQLTSGGLDAVQPAVSPDGRWIAFHSVARGGIWTMPALGGEARRVVATGSAPAWMPDGRDIVFQSSELTTVSQDAFPAFPPSELWTVGATGGEPRQLTWAGQPRGGHGTPAVSPDGRWIAFTAYELGVAGLWVMPAGGGEPWRVESVSRPYDPVFSAGGERLVVIDRDDDWLVDLAFDAATGRTAGEPRRLAPIEGRHVAVAPGGERFVVTRMSATSDLWTLPLAPETGLPAGEPARLTRDTSQRTSSPSFSPAGDRLAYATVRAGAAPEIWTIGADGSGARRLAGPVAGAFHPFWLADGRRVAHMESAADGRWLVGIDVDTRRARRIAPLGEDWAFPSPDPAGRRVAFHRSGGGTTNVWVATVGEEEPIQVTADAQFAGFPVWSPDGRFLAVELLRPAASRLGVVPAGGGRLREIRAARGHSWPGDWSPDGGKILFSGLRDGRWNLYWVPVAGGPERQLTHHDASLASFVRYPDWSPRGDRIVYERRRTSGDLWQIELPGDGPVR